MSLEKLLVCGFSVDITNLRKEQIEREDLIEALKDNLYFEQSLKKVTELLSSYKDLKSLLTQILEEVNKIVPSISSNIALFEGKILKNVAIRGYDKFGIDEFVKNFQMNIEDYPIEKDVVLNKKPVLIKDTRKEKRWILFNETSFIKSHLIIPIVLRENVIGLLRLDSDKENAFTISDIEKLLIFANSIGITIDNLRHLERIKGVAEQIILLITKISELKDPFTAGHQKKVAEIAVKIAKKMNFSEEKIETIRYAALLHDIGKMILPIEILTKPAKLTPVEYEIIKEHPIIARELLENIDFPYPIKDIIVQHHERLNGSGYPFGLKNGEILIESKILTVADVVEAMSAHRPYRSKSKPEEIIDELVKNINILYDKEVVDALIDLYKNSELDFS